MSGVRVIGIGSPFDSDQLGWQVIDVLSQDQAQKIIPAEIDLVHSDRPGAGLLSLFEDVDCVVLIDAIVDSDLKDEVQRLVKEDLLLNPTKLSSHGFGVAEALSLGDKLGLLPDQVILYGLGTDNTHTFRSEQIRQVADVVTEALCSLDAA